MVWPLCIGCYRATVRPPGPVFVLNTDDCRISRTILHGSVKNLQIDDALIVFATVRIHCPVSLSTGTPAAPQTDADEMLQCVYTVLIVGMQIIANTNSNLIPPEHGLEFNPEDIKERIYGSKMVLVVEQCMCVTIWTIKACLLIMYSRLT